MHTDFEVNLGRAILVMLCPVFRNARVRAGPEIALFLGVPFHVILGEDVGVKVGLISFATGTVCGFLDVVIYIRRRLCLVALCPLLCHEQDELGR